MPKLRNGANDLEMFTQWIGRKCRNHNPLAELEMGREERGRQPSRYESSPSYGVFVAGDENNQVFYEAAGRVFRVTVEEVDREVVYDTVPESERKRVLA